MNDSKLYCPKPEGVNLSDWVAQHLQIAKDNAHLNAFVHLFDVEAIEDAKRIEAEIAAGRQPGRMYGVVISVKDNICIAGRQVSAASAILKNYVSPFSATAIERLVQEDAIIIGTTNCDEFGMGSASTHSVYGPVRNGHDPQRVAGGSSGGAAVSVQMGACHLAVGTDTGGSIRQPAAFCHLTGFKPGYGKISRHGLIAYASSFDQLGFISREESLIKTAFWICKGPDDFDSTVSKSPEKPIRGLEQCRLVSLSNFFQDENPFTQKIKTFIQDLTQWFPVKTENFEGVEYLVPAYYILTTAEASTNLSRFDGVRYGFRSAEADTLEKMYTLSRTQGFGSEVKKRIMLGTFVLSEGYYDAYYTKAQKVRQKVRNQLLHLLEDNDFIVLPVTASEPWLIESISKDPMEIYYSDVYTVLASLAGLPAISVPVSTEQGVIQLQVIAAPNDEHNLLAFSEKLKSLYSH